jgi:hypothetical protein
MVTKEQTSLLGKEVAQPPHTADVFWGVSTINTHHWHAHDADVQLSNPSTSHVEIAVMSCIWHAKTREYQYVAFGRVLRMVRV